MIAVVVLTHDRVHLLRQCVENVLARTSELTTEIIIWDNASQDGTSDYLATLHDPRFRVVTGQRNIGQNAYAEAFALTMAPYMIELDDDVIGAPPRWDETLLTAFQKIPNIGFLAADLEDDEHDSAAHIRYRVRPHLYVPQEVNGIRIFNGPTGGGCAMTSRVIYDSVGGFRQTRRHIFWEEETAYVTDIGQAGFVAAVLADLRVHHAGGPHYSKQSAAKHAYWTQYWRRQHRRNQVKRLLLRVPLVDVLNTRFKWFRLSDDSPTVMRKA